MGESIEKKIFCVNISKCYILTKTIFNLEIIMNHSRAIKLFFLVLFGSMQAREVRFLTPPQLGPENVLQEVLCHRPVRKEQPCIKREEYNGTIIIQHYGHGSGGWTVGLGSANYAASLLTESEKHSRIVIVGAGVIGLCTAYKLVNLGFTNITIMAKSFDNLTSHKAGGLFAYMSSNPDATIANLVNNLAMESYQEYAQIARQQHPDFTQGARFLPAYFPSRETSDLEPYVLAGIMQPAQDVVIDFNNGTQHDMVVYDDCIFIDTPYMMHALKTFLEDNSVTFIQQEVTDLFALDYPIIINCTGLGAAELAGDQNLYPAQGHLLLLKNQNPVDLNYMIELVYEYGTTDDGMPLSRAVYLFPKKLLGSANNEIGVLGGTFINNATEATPHYEEFGRVLKNAQQFFDIA
jgi:glycine/D-amino acid oxidase-like deaminating enzyme